MARKAILLIALLIAPTVWAGDEEAPPTRIDDDEESSLWLETPESRESTSCVAACIANGEAAIDCEESCVQIAGALTNSARGSRLCRSVRPAPAAPRAAL
jgi:hypothetical protein